MTYPRYHYHSLLFCDGELVKDWVVDVSNWHDTLPLGSVKEGSYLYFDNHPYPWCVYRNKDYQQVKEHEVPKEYLLLAMLLR